MDPALWEILRSRNEGDDEEVEAIIRLGLPPVDVPGVRIVSTFGEVATCRLDAGSVRRVRQNEGVLSLKAPRPLGPELPVPHDQVSLDVQAADIRRPPNVPLTGAGVVVGIVDWGCDFGHPNFRHPDGSTRLRALWDQRGPGGVRAPRPYGYGIVHDRRQINDALRTSDPYETLGYHPAEADRDGTGAHGTHVMDIAAGNALGGGPIGIAPQAELVFVHLADRGTGGLASLGDSVRVLEAVDFVARVAGQRPWVINLSLGRCGGSHDGRSLVELALDHVLAAAPGRFIVQSAGNYFDKSIHASGRLAPGETRRLTMITQENDLTPNELEVWYDGGDELAVQVESPTGGRSSWVRLGERADINDGGRTIGRIYHRDRDPNNLDNHIDVFLDPWAPAGRWGVTLRASQVRDGRFHAWLERDESCPDCQTRFDPADADNACTTGTIANGRLPLVVGAYDAHAPARTLAHFSSAGPTRDGRSKPDLVAPGIQVLAARSTPWGSRTNSGQLTRKSGTSMATPHVTGAVALCLQGAPRPLTADEIRTLILSATSDAPSARGGRGYFDIDRLLAALPTPGDQRPKEATMSPNIKSNPDRLYREIVYSGGATLPTWIDSAFEVLARPGEAPRRKLANGDVMVRVALGEPGGGQIAVLSHPMLKSRWGLAQGQIAAEPGGAGWYALVGENGPAWRLLDETGRMPLGQILLRRRTRELDAEAELDWTGTPEQIAFREAVLEAHLARSRRRKGEPGRDLSPQELGRVTGTRVWMRADAAAQAGLLISAANEALAQATQAGHPDAAKTSRITANSGYRGSEYQAEIWRRNFPGYYRRTAAQRAALAGGPHGTEAVDYMINVFKVPNWVAAPGYSNHQVGIAIDLVQKRTGTAIRNSSRPQALRAWRNTWFFEWLNQNAANFGFRPYEKEPWHWEYRPDGEQRSAAAETAEGAGDPSELEVTWTPAGSFETGTLTAPADPGEKQVTVKAVRFPGQTSEVALIFAGVHGSEPQGGQVANALIDLLKKARTKPKFTTIVIPLLFEPSRRPNSNTRYVKSTFDRTAKPIEPNRNFPQPGESYAYARQRGKVRKYELLGCDGRALSGELLMARMLPETRILIQFIERLQPKRVASLHAHSIKKTFARGDDPGIFVDPRGGFNEHDDVAWTVAGTADDSLARLMLDEALTVIGPELPLKDDSGEVELRHPLSGNLAEPGKVFRLGTAKTVHYTSTAHPCGTSFGMWAPADEFGLQSSPDDRRPGSTTLTIEVPRYENAKTATKKVIAMHTRVLARTFLGLAP